MSRPDHELGRWLARVLSEIKGEPARHATPETRPGAYQRALPGVILERSDNAAMEPEAD